APVHAGASPAAAAACGSNLVQEIFKAAKAAALAGGPPRFRVAHVLTIGVRIEPLSESLFSKLIVQSAFILIKQNLARVGGFLEPLLGLLVPRIAVRVVLAGQLSVRLADLLLGRVARHAEHLIKIATRHWIDGRATSLGRRIAPRKISTFHCA